VLVPGAVELVALGLGSYWGARSIIQNSPVESRDRNAGFASLFVGNFEENPGEGEMIETSA
jgi:hypothetical protein